MSPEFVSRADLDSVTSLVVHTNLCRCIKRLPLERAREERGVFRHSSELLNCVVFRNSQPGIHECESSFRVADNFQAVNFGNITAVGELGNSSKATITIDCKQTPSRIEIASLSERKAPNPRDQVGKLAPSLVNVGRNNQTYEVLLIALFCVVPACFLCDSRCFSEYQSKDPQIPHVILPICGAGQNTDEYVRKFSNLKKAVVELRRNMIVSVDNIINH